MRKVQILLTFFSILILVQVSDAQPGVHTAKTGGEVIRLIRNEKLDLILPGAMRDNNVDMWIHVTRAGDPDPMAPHFGSTNGYLIFTDLGDRIERAVFGSAGAVENIDVGGSREISLAFAGYDYGNLDPGVYDEITEFVAERDPKTIAVNTSDWIATADGISYSQYLKLEKILGPKYSSRIVSAERVITTFRKRRVLREVTGFSNALETHRQIFERALSNEVITPGVTTIADVGMWVKEELFKRHMTGYGTWAGSPRVLYSAKSKRIALPDARWWINHGSYVLQRGDFFTYDLGVKYLDYFGTDYKRNAYILREGETSVPEDIQHAFDRAIAAHEIFRNNIKVGRTVGQTKEVIISAMEDAGYIYTPFIDIGEEDYRIVQRALANTDKSGFSFDFHQQGNDGGSFMYGGPTISPYLHDRDHLVIDENNLFAFEYMVHTNLPNLRPGFPISLNIEGNHIVSSRGVEFLHPPNERILLIH